LMQCYRHNEREALAICSHCGKAACADCSDDTGQGIACSTSCVVEIQAAYQLKQRLQQSFGVGAKPPMPPTVSMYAFFGLILLAVGVYLTYTRPGIDYLTLALSAVFFVMSGISWKRYRDVCLTCR